MNAMKNNHNCFASLLMKTLIIDKDCVNLREEVLKLSIKKNITRGNTIGSPI